MKTAKRMISLLLCCVLLVTVFGGAGQDAHAQTESTLSIDSIVTDLSSPQPAGAALTITAKGSGGTGGLQYKFSYEKDGAWVRIQDYSKSDTARFRPPVAGDYTLTVFVKDTSGAEIAKGIPFAAKEAVPVTASPLSVGPSESQPVGSVVSLKTSAGGGQGDFEYKFSYEKDGNWVRIQDYSPSSEALWVPSETGNYTLVAFVRDAAGTEVVSSAPFQVTAPPKISVDFISAVPSSGQQVGDTVALSAKGSGGVGQLQYKFSYEKDGVWVRIQDYSSSNTAQWVPQQPGDYTLTVFIRDANGTEIAKGTPFRVEAGDPPVITELSVDKPSPQHAGNSLQLSAQASKGVGQLQYKFSYEKDGVWVRIQDYSSSQTATWTPEQPGDYQLVVFVKDSQGVEVTKGMPYRVTESIPLRIRSFTADIPSPQYTGSSIRLTAEGEGEGKLQYQFLCRIDGVWEEIQGYSDKSSAVWEPAIAGNYALAVYVKNSQGQETSKILTYEIKAKKPIVIASFQAEKSSPQLVGTQIKLTASASGGEGALQYRFAYQKDGQWMTLRDYSAQGAATWTPITAGTYTLGVFVKDSSGTEELKTMSFQIRTPDPIVVTALLASPNDSQMLGSEVALAASARGGEGELRYRFAYRKGEVNWTTIQDYSSQQAIRWTPREAGEYQVAVFVKDAMGNEEQKSLSYVVNQPDPVEVTKFTMDLPSPQQPGTTVYLSASAKGGVGDYQYRFAYKEGANWVYLGDYSSRNYATWTPSKPGVYTLGAFVRDRLGAEGQKTASFTIEQKDEPLEITGFSTDKASPQLEGASIKLTAQAKGGSGSLEYRFSYQQAGGSWTTIRDYGSNSATWTPQQAGLYTLRVTVRSGNKEISRDVSYVVNRYIAADTGGITLSGTKGTVPAGKNLYVKATGSSKIKWTTDNPSIATVSEEGYILGVNPGQARIVAYDDAGRRVSCIVTVEKAAPVKFAYTSPNIVPKTGEVTLVAITDLTRTEVEFDVQQGSGSKTVKATQKVKDGNTYKWTVKISATSAGVFNVKAYSKAGGGGWETCDDGKTSMFVTSSTDVMTTRVEERRASDRCLDFIATCEGFSSQVYPDTLAGNIPTIAYGYVFYPGQTFYNNLTRDEGWALLVQETNRGGYTSSVNQFLTGNSIRCNQQQFDSLVSFSYNVGTGWITSSNTKDLRNILLRARSTVGNGGSGVTITTGIVSGGGEGINVRSGPGTNYPVKYALSDGTVVALIDQTKYNGAWYKLKTNDGSAAYCHSDYIVNVVTTGDSSGGSSGGLDLNCVDKDALIMEMASWHHAGGKCVLGLLTRRFDELEIFLYGEYGRGYRLSDHKFPIPSCYQ
ncbi:MAG: SH3 domain-containing protein [Clostridiales bacterium]|jgi:GH24 family phage-related lysozyme (muramidase)|nr:SH3 domain-containing protein [Clostridiales bacterium]